MIITLTPTHGRDYPSARDARQAFAKGELFALQPSGVYMDIRDLPRLQAQNPISAVAIKYKAASRTLMIPLWKLQP